MGDKSRIWEACCDAEEARKFASSAEVTCSSLGLRDLASDLRRAGLYLATAAARLEELSGHGQAAKKGGG